MGISGLGVRGVLTTDDTAGEIGVVGIGRGFAVRGEVGELKVDWGCDRRSGCETWFCVREESLNWSQVMLFLEGILVWFRLMELRSDVFVEYD